MDAKEYLRKAVAICVVFEEQGRCHSDCPLRKLACGVPKDEAEQVEAIRIVEEFTEPRGPYICPQCQNEEHPAGAQFCMICGLKIGGEDA